MMFESDSRAVEKPERDREVIVSYPSILAFNRSPETLTMEEIKIKDLGTARCRE